MRAAVALLLASIALSPGCSRPAPPAPEKLTAGPKGVGGDFAREEAETRSLVEKYIGNNVEYLSWGPHYRMTEADREAVRQSPAWKQKLADANALAEKALRESGVKDGPYAGEPPTAGIRVRLRVPQAGKEDATLDLIFWPCDLFAPRLGGQIMRTSNPNGDAWIGMQVTPAKGPLYWVR